jgi:hypothetical protein
MPRPLVLAVPTFVLFLVFFRMQLSVVASLGEANASSSGPSANTGRDGRWR